MVTPEVLESRRGQRDAVKTWKLPLQTVGPGKAQRCIISLYPFFKGMSAEYARHFLKTSCFTLTQHTYSHLTVAKKSCSLVADWLTGDKDTVKCSAVEHLLKEHCLFTFKNHISQIVQEFKTVPFTHET